MKIKDRILEFKKTHPDEFMFASLATGLGLIVAAVTVISVKFSPDVPDDSDTPAYEYAPDGTLLLRLIDGNTFVIFQPEPEK